MCYMCCRKAPVIMHMGVSINRNPEMLGLWWKIPWTWMMTGGTRILGTLHMKKTCSTTVNTTTENTWALKTIFAGWAVHVQDPYVYWNHLESKIVKTYSNVIKPIYKPSASSPEIWIVYRIIHRQVGAVYGIGLPTNLSEMIRTSAGVTDGRHGGLFLTHPGRQLTLQQKRHPEKCGRGQAAGMDVATNTWGK